MAAKLKLTFFLLIPSLIFFHVLQIILHDLTNDFTNHLLASQNLMDLSEIGLSWGWHSAKRYFLLFENNTDRKLAKDSNNHNTKGDLTVSGNSYETVLADAYIAAVKSLGYKEIDLNGDHRVGVMKFQGTIRNGKRCSLNKAYLHPARKRKNLHIAKLATVTKIHIENGLASKVTFQKKKYIKTVKARKEIILAAGTFGSAQLLMRTGIGPKQHLSSLGIKVLADLPVGLNFQDHGGVYLYYEVEEGLGKRDFMDPYAILNFSIHSEGPLTSVYGHEAIALLDSSESRRNNIPDIEMIFISSIPLEEKTGYMIGGFPLRPKSKGKVMLKSSNPYDSPIIDPNYLSNAYDRKLLMEMVEITMRLAKSTPLAKLKPKLSRELFPKCPQDPSTKEFIVCLCKEYTVSGHNPVGTCSMGPKGVVNSDLKVHGFKGLRVIDASVIPKLPSSNINSIVVMIAEKASDIIKHAHNKQTVLK